MSIKLTLLIFMLFTNYTFPKNDYHINIAPYNDAWNQECIVKSTDGNPLLYNPLLVLDGKLQTAVNFFTNRYSYSYFSIHFAQDIIIDKIVIYNGYQKNNDIYQKNQRINLVNISGFNYSYIPKITFESDIINVITPLKDITNAQIINFSNAVKCNTWAFGADSTYPGTKYTDIAVSEIEFWYKGQKYEIANLHQVMMAYSNYIVKARLFWIPEYPAVLFSYHQPEKDEIIISNLTVIGLEPNKIRYVEFRKKDMNVYVYKKDTLFKSEKESIKNIDYKNGIKIGQWKTDKWGVLWIRIGKGKWKSTIDYDKFTGTDLENAGVDYFYDDYPVP